MATTPSAFWEDLAEDLQDPEFLRAYVIESIRIETVDRLLNQLDHVRERAGLSKADLARAISTEPAVVRRLLSLNHRNPTIGTLAEVAAALGCRVTLEPLPNTDREMITEPLRSGTTGVPQRLAQALHAKRTSRRPKSVC